MMNPAEFANIARVEKEFWWFQGMQRILFRLLDAIMGERTPTRVLEAGCGTGYFAGVLQRERGWHVLPIDLGWEGLQWARARHVEELVQADVHRLPFPDRSFDLVLSLDVIVHFPRGEENKAMRELTRVLVPGGLLVLRVAALDILRSRHSQFTCERQRFTRRRAKELARTNNIRVLHCTYANSLLLPLALVKFRLLEPLLNKPPASGVRPLPRWLDRLLYMPLEAESVWLATGLDLPLGQSLILIGEKVSP